MLILSILGKSDPYVKIKYREKTIYKTKIIDKTLDPTWDETFMLPIADMKHHVYIRVYDYDRFSDNDFMGKARIDIADLDKDK